MVDKRNLPPSQGGSKEMSAEHAKKAGVQVGVDAPEGRLGGSVVDPFVGRTIGNFRLEEVIGRGGFGVVYRATQVYLQKPFAVKLLHLNKEEVSPEVIERFRREAQALAHLEHENIVQVIDFGPMEEGSFYLIMEYLEGITLRECLLQQIVFDLERLKNITRQLCNALHFIHKKGIIHRDLKPANIFLTQTEDGKDRVKLIDFGIALLSGRKKLTQAGIYLGTANFTSPERFSAEYEVDGRSDLYSLSTILFLLLTRQLPFRGKNSFFTIQQHIRLPPPTLQQKASWKAWTPELEAFFQRALAKKPDNRPANGHAFWEQLEEALDRQASLDAQHARKTSLTPSITAASEPNTTEPTYSLPIEEVQEPAPSTPDSSSTPKGEEKASPLDDDDTLSLRPEQKNAILKSFAPAAQQNKAASSFSKAPPSGFFSSFEKEPESGPANHTLHLSKEPPFERGFEESSVPSPLDEDDQTVLEGPNALAAIISKAKQQIQTIAEDPEDEVAPSDSIEPSHSEVPASGSVDATLLNVEPPAESDPDKTLLGAEKVVPPVKPASQKTLPDDPRLKPQQTLPDDPRLNPFGEDDETQRDARAQVQQVLSAASARKPKYALPVNNLPPGEERPAQKPFDPELTLEQEPTSVPDLAALERLAKGKEPDTLSDREDQLPLGVLVSDAKQSLPEHEPLPAKVPSWLPWTVAGVLLLLALYLLFRP